MPIPSQPRRPQTPKPPERNAAAIPIGFFRAALVFAVATWALFALLGPLGMSSSVERFGVAVVAACVLTPIAVILIDGWWKLLAKPK